MVIWEHFVDYTKINFTPAERERGRKARVSYAQEICAFDIETSRFQDIEQSAMYIWQFSINNHTVIIGRYWPEFLHMLSELKKRLNGLTVLCFVHNLSFEGQFLSGIYDFENDEVFATESRHLLKMSMFGAFEFRCSYRLFNMSLDAVTKKYKCNYAKRSGADFDYSITRTASTPLSHKELLYCVYDVLGLIEAIHAQMELFGDTVYTLPFTQTGYVRREARQEMKPYRGEIHNCFPPYECFLVMRQAFRGGNTHASRFYVGDIIEHVHGNDVSSEYPAQQVLEQYPRSPFKQAGCMSLTWRYYEKLLSLGHALLIVVEFKQIELKDKYNGFPYISRAKAIGGVWSGQEDNGRILKASYIKLAVTDIDFSIIESTYKWQEANIIDMWAAKYGPMYDGIINLNKRLFMEKTKLKGVVGQELYYAKSKEQLNALYGMTVQNPLTRDLLFIHPTKGRYVPSDLKSDETLYKEVRNRAFITYQLGLWTTAHARAELQKFIDRAGDAAIYCDTDSLMYTDAFGPVNFDDFNAEYIKRCEESGPGAYADDSNGRRRYMGVFESEDDKKAGCKFERFITQGAKRYAFEKPGGGIGITVAGVNKKQGAAELERRGGLEAFKPGFIFEDSGKLESVYRDEPYGKYDYNGEEINITANVTLRPTTYELSHSKDYAALLRTVGKRELYKALEELAIMNK